MEKLLILEDDMALATRADRGVNVTLFTTLQLLTKLRKSTLSAYLGIDPKTVDNYKQKQQKFKPSEAEKLLKLHRLFGLGEELFGSMSEFTAWLELPCPGLENRKPTQLLSTVTGINLVEQQLLRLAHGYVA